MLRQPRPFDMQFKLLHRLALLSAAWLGLASTPAQAALTDGWPQLKPGGRKQLVELLPQLERQAMLLVSAAAQERKACDGARNKGHGCGEELQNALLQLQSVAQGLDDLGRQLSDRLATPPASEVEADAVSCANKLAEACHRQAADNASLDAFAQLRVAPALDRLARLAGGAEVGLQQTRGDRDADAQKLPKKKGKPGQAAQPEVPIVVGVDRKDDAPPPPPPPKLWVRKCKAGKVAVCVDVAYIYELRKEPELAVDFWKLACKLGHQPACTRVAPPAKK